jgi:hypothetical protein
MERVAAVQPRPNFRVWLRFTDGAEGEVDLSHLAGRGVFAALNEPGFFATVAVDPLTRTICWPGGIDLDPDVLHSKLTGKAIPDTDAAA